MKKAILNSVMLAIALMATATASAQRDMQLTVSNIPNDKGQILIATKSGQWAKVKAEKGKIETTVKDVPDGKGKIYVFHDENGNGQLDEKDNIPMEYCAFGDYEMSENNSKVNIELIYVPDKMKGEVKQNK